MTSLELYQSRGDDFGCDCVRFGFIITQSSKRSARFPSVDMFVYGRSGNCQTSLLTVGLSFMLRGIYNMFIPPYQHVIVRGGDNDN